MAEVSRTGTPTPVNVLAVRDHSLSGLYAGEALAGGDAVYINADGKVYKASGAAANAAARCRGFAAKVASAGDAVTILRPGVRLAYGPNVAGTPSAPGADLYLSATIPGGLSDTATAGGTTPVAFVVDTDGRIEISR